MKNKIIIISVIIIIILTTLSILVYANKEDRLVSERKLDTISIEQISRVLEPKDINKLAVNKKEDVINIANSYLQNFESKAKSIGKSEELTIEYMHRGLWKRNEIMVDTKDYSFTINADTGKLTNYSKHVKEFPKCKLLREEIEIIANKLFKKTDICNVDDYKMTYLEEYEEGVWCVGYVKKYGDLINNGEFVKFHFFPQTEEIWVLGTDEIKYDNNEILISEEIARKVANQYLEKSVATDMKIYLDIVNPNEFLSTEKLNVNEIYTFVPYMRKAYVCEFNNKGKTQIYVDCTTGDVIGGTNILGGDF